LSFPDEYAGDKPMDWPGGELEKNSSSTPAVKLFSWIVWTVILGVGSSTKVWSSFVDGAMCVVVVVGRSG
jgi:hypothetical protein